MHAKIAYFAPHDPGYVEDISGVAILKSSQHQAAAQKFVHFLTSAAGQRVLAAQRQLRVPASTPASPPTRSCTPLDQLATVLVHARRSRHRARRQDAAPRSRAHLSPVVP